MNKKVPDKCDLCDGKRFVWCGPLDGSGPKRIPCPECFPGLSKPHPPTEELILEELRLIRQALEALHQGQAEMPEPRCFYCKHEAESCRPRMGAEFCSGWRQKYKEEDYKMNSNPVPVDPDNPDYECTNCKFNGECSGPIKLKLPSSVREGCKKRVVR